MRHCCHSTGAAGNSLGYAFYTMIPVRLSSTRAYHAITSQLSNGSLLRNFSASSQWKDKPISDITVWKSAQFATQQRFYSISCPEQEESSEKTKRIERVVKAGKVRKKTKESGKARRARKDKIAAEGVKTEKSEKSEQDEAKEKKFEYVPKPKAVADPAAIKESLDKAVSTEPQDLRSWGQVFSIMRENHGNDGLWAAFELAREKNQIHHFLSADAEAVRENIMDAAAAEDARIESIIIVDQKLRALSHAGWPNLYVKFMHALIRRPNAVRTLEWHARLSESFKPDSEEFAGMLSNFVSAPSTRIQRTLRQLYMASGERQLFDRIVPALFEAGNLSLARDWRKLLLKFEDYPSSPESWSFLEFFRRYYPQTKMTEQELAILPKGVQSSYTKAGFRAGSEPRPSPVEKPTHDGLVAKWFASSWVSVEFAINLVQRLGTRTIGARSLQALALREVDAQGVADRITQLESLGIDIDDQAYCVVVSHFARSGEEELLQNLLRCDIHPEEFDDPTKRAQLMADAIRQEDKGREALLKGVESTFQELPTRQQINEEMSNEFMATELQRRPLGKSLIVLDRMDALKLSINEENATTLLKRVFDRIGWHPAKWIPLHGEREYALEDLDRAIKVTRRLGSHNIPIPMKRWQTIFYNLGRLGRYDELQELLVEFTQLFRPKTGKLVRITDLGKTGDTYYIPVELPFTHRTHPVQELIDPAMQRSIIRWTFDQTLLNPPQAIPDGRTKPSDFDIAAGVRILATLRDKGVLIEKGQVKSTVEARLVSARLPSKNKHRSRDEQELSSENVKALVDVAWGDLLVPSLAKFNKDLEAQKEHMLKASPGKFKERDIDLEEDESTVETAQKSQVFRSSPGLTRLKKILDGEGKTAL